MNLKEEIEWFEAGGANCGDRTAALVRALIDDRKKLRTILMKTTGCLGLLIRGCNPEAQVYTDAYMIGKKTIKETQP